MIRTLMVVASVMLICALPLAAAPETDKALAAAIAAPERDAANSVRDRWRHPAQSLTFWGLKPGMTVVDVAPGGGYWSEILAPYTQQTNGRYFAAMAKAGDLLPGKFSDKARYGDIAYTVFSNSSGPMAPAGKTDLVLAARNIHDWMWTPGMAEKSMRDFYAVLKPGGILAVEEHRADPRPMVKEARDGYVNTSYIIAIAKKAGFTLEAQSEINANPKDTKDHPFGVWTLPPTRQSAEKGKTQDPKFDRAKYDAIGESDRMTLRFRKPG
jgi:predicted methyltransferase